MSLSLYVFMHLCIYARAWQLSWPWLDTDKEHTAAVEPERFQNSDLASWLDPSPAGCLWRELRSWRGGDTGRRQRWSEGTDRRTVRNKVARMSHPCHLASVCNFTLRCSFKCAVSLNVTPQSNLSLHEMKTEQKQLRNELSGCECVCMHLTKRQNKRT